jgi:hypothetical protein
MLFLAIWGSGYALLRLPDAGVLADPEKRRNALRFIDSLRWGAFLALTAGAGATMVWLVMIT